MVSKINSNNVVTPDTLSSLNTPSNDSDNNSNRFRWVEVIQPFTPTNANQVVLVFGLNRLFDERKIGTIFSHTGLVHEVNIITSNNQQQRNEMVGFVKYYSPKSAELAIEKIHNQYYYGTTLTCKLATTLKRRPSLPIHSSKLYNLLNHYLGFNGWSKSIDVVTSKQLTRSQCNNAKVDDNGTTESVAAEIDRRDKDDIIYLFIAKISFVFKCHSIHNDPVAKQEYVTACGKGEVYIDPLEHADKTVVELKKMGRYQCISKALCNVCYNFVIVALGNRKVRVVVKDDTYMEDMNFQAKDYPIPIAKDMIKPTGVRTSKRFFESTNIFVNGE